MEKKKTITIGILLISIMAISLVSADYFACFNKGDIIKFCNPLVNQNRCGNSNQCTAPSYQEICMKSYDELNACYTQGSLKKCNKNAAEKCSNSGGGASSDGIPPEFTSFSSPEEGDVYTSRSVLLDFTLDEISTVYFLDNIGGRGRWSRVCKNCFSYSKKRSWKEGFNNVTFRARDMSDNEMNKTVTFTIDSKKPKIKKVEIGQEDEMVKLKIQIQEENPVSLKFKFGNATDEEELIFNIEDDCIEGRSKKFECELQRTPEEYIALVTPYHGQEIKYWAELVDIAENTVESKPKKTDIDIVAPDIVNKDEPDLWTQGEGRNNKYIYFNIEIDEDNFDEVGYLYEYKGKMKWKRLCNRLKDNRCVKKQSFKKGNHIISIVAFDEAGNYDEKEIEFEVV